MKAKLLASVPPRILLRAMQPLTSDSYRDILLSAASRLGIVGTA